MPMRACEKCGRQYDDDSFRVRVKGTERTWKSYQCHECAQRVSDKIEIVEAKK
jgi:uncharacterized protein YlaI